MTSKPHCPKLPNEGFTEIWSKHKGHTNHSKRLVETRLHNLTWKRLIDMVDNVTDIVAEWRLCRHVQHRAQIALRT